MAAADAAHLRHAETWVFDLDNTLYPASSNLFAQIDVRIRDYIGRFLGVDADQAYRLQKRYFHDHGTSLKGMMVRHAMDPEPFLEYVHDIDLLRNPGAAPECDETNRRRPASRAPRLDREHPRDSRGPSV